MSKRELTDEERQRRRELAQRLHAEGRFGGPQPGSGRPKKPPRAAQLVGEAAKERDNAQAMITALKDALQPGQAASIRVQATKTWLEIEAKEDELQLKEEIAMEGLQRDQLARSLAEKLAKLVEAGYIPAGFIEGEAEEIKGELEIAN